MRLLLFNLATDADDSAVGFAISWIVELAKQAAHIDIITMRAGRYDLPEHVRVYSVGKEKGYNEFRRFIEFYRLLVRLLRQQRYDACFAHMMPLFVVMAAPILRLHKIPIVLWYAHKSVPLMLRLATLFAQRIVTSVQEGFGIKTPKLRIIGQGIDVNQFTPDEHALDTPHPFALVTVGRLTRRKHVELLLQGVARFIQAYPDLQFTFTIIGGPYTFHDEAYVQELRTYVSDAHLDHSVRFEGCIPYQQIPSHYQKADCFVSMSDTGSIDKAILEAMSCGIIPIMTNHALAGTFDQSLAALCMIDADPGALAEHLFRVHSLSFEKRRALGRQLRELVVRDHSLQKLSQKILEECAAAQQSL